MRRFTFGKFGRVAVLAVVLSLSAVCGLGCGGDDDSAGSSGNNSTHWVSMSSAGVCLCL